MKLSIIIYQFQLNTNFLSWRFTKKRSRFLLNDDGGLARPAQEKESETDIKQHENAKKKSINYRNESHFSAQLLTSLELAHCNLILLSCSCQALQARELKKLAHFYDSHVIVLTLYGRHCNADMKFCLNQKESEQKRMIQQETTFFILKDSNPIMKTNFSC